MVTTFRQSSTSENDSLPVYDPDESNCTPEARLYLGGKRVPLINDGVRLEWRKDGPLDYQFTADAYTSAVDANGRDWVDVYNRSIHGVADIEMYDPVFDRHRHVARGIVTAIGPGNTTSNETRLHIVDTAIFAKQIPALKEFRDMKLTLADIPRYVKSALEDRLDTFDSVTVEDIPDQDGSDPATVEIQKKFRPHRHHLSDVLRKVTQHRGIFYWFDHDREIGNDTIVLRNGTLDNPPQHSAQAIGGNVQLFENNMVAEINPVNQLKLHGKANIHRSKQTGEPGSEEALESLSAELLPVAIVEHEPSVDVAGTTIRLEKSTNAEDLSVLKQQAKKKLKNHLDSAGFGDAIMRIAPFITPYDILELPFRCGGPVFTYEVERVTHHAGATQSGPDGRTERDHARSEVQCSFATQMSDIEVVKARYDNLDGS